LGQEVDGDSLSSADEEDINIPDQNHKTTSGLQAYNNMIRSMLARLECNNALAPIHEYGRHQSKLNIKKKKKKAKVETEAVDNQVDMIEPT
jgi:hypothetical protein